MKNYVDDELVILYILSYPAVVDQFKGFWIMFLITKEGITRWLHKLKKNLYIKNSIYFALLVHRQE
jgi:hypothetical protein